MGYIAFLSMYYSCKAGNLKLTKFFRKCGVIISDFHMEIAIKNGHFNIVKYLVEEGTRVYHWHIYTAEEYNQNEILEYLKDKKPTIEKCFEENKEDLLFMDNVVGVAIGETHYRYIGQTPAIVVFVKGPTNEIPKKIKEFNVDVREYNTLGLQWITKLYTKEMALQKCFHDNRDNLLKIDNVVGVGVGHGEILVFIKEHSGSISPDIPKEIDGFPIKVDELGTPKLH